MAAYLADIEGYAYEEPPRSWHPIGTVMSRLHRGRGRVRDMGALRAGSGARPHDRLTMRRPRRPGTPGRGAARAGNGTPGPGQRAAPCAFSQPSAIGS